MDRNGRKILQSQRAYKICAASDWERAVAAGAYAGAPVDIADGYIHLSTAAQIGDTLRRHFAGRAGLVLVAIDLGKLGDTVRWEPSRGGDLFPHIYGPLPIIAAIERQDIPDEDEARTSFARQLMERA
jgi:uncharacterized protein (DUF952 family)